MQCWKRRAPSAANNTGSDAGKRALGEADEELTACKDRILELEKLWDQAVLDKAKAILHHHKQLDGIRQARHALLEAQVLLMEAESDVGVLKAKNSEITRQLEEERRILENAKAEQEEQKGIAEHCKVDALSVITEQNQAELSAKARERTVEDVDQSIQVEKAKLEVIHASNPTALEEYERYAAKIERERANQANQESKMAELNARIQDVKSRWEPKLDELVSQINDAFSYNFEQISCAGEVGVHKDEDFEKWAIEIRVKFRYIPSLAPCSFATQKGKAKTFST
jgi:chromosome segregation ATPase